MCVYVRTTLEKLYFHSFQIKWDMIVVTAFLSILNQMEIHLVQNRKENCFSFSFFFFLVFLYFGSQNRKEIIFFYSILNQMELHLVQNRRKSCHHDRIPFNVEGKLSPRSYPIHFERKWKHSFVSARYRAQFVFMPCAIYVMGLGTFPLAVRETSVSRQKGGSIRGVPETPQYESAVMVQRVSGGSSIGHT